MKKFLLLLTAVIVVIIGCARQAQGDFDKKAMDFIRSNEGVRKEAYLDTLGYWTIGVGHLIGKKLTLPVTLTDEQVEELFRKDYYIHLAEAKRNFPMFDDLNDEGKMVLVDMTFNLGGSKFNKNKWPNYYAALEAGDWVGMAKSARNSLWCKQVKTRCDKIEALILKARYK